MKTSSVAAALVCALAACEAGKDTAAPAGPPVPEPPPCVDCIAQRPLEPPPITGGTLAVRGDGAVAVAADPDRGLVYLVDLERGEVRHTVDVKGDEPGRAVLSGDRGFVALRRGGAVLRVDLVTGGTARYPTCASPRGLALQGEALHVACADGTLDTLSAATGARTRRVHLPNDLRDVIATAGRLFVTRFRAAEVLALDEAGRVTHRMTPPTLPGPVPGEVVAGPVVAWRTVATDDGRLLMLHQRASLRTVGVQEDGGYGRAPAPDFCGNGISGTAVTEFLPDGTARPVASLVGAGLTVDLAPGRGPRAFALAAPGNVAADDESGGGSLRGGAPVYQAAELVTEDGREPCLFGDVSEAPEARQTTAVAMDDLGRLYAQSREPALLWDERGHRIELSDTSVRSEAHDLFHRDAGRGLACATCHPEGGDDGHTWLFEGHGLRRTQFLAGGLRGTAPFHWGGDLDDFGALMSEVLVRRMGGDEPTPEAARALFDWLDALPVPPAPQVDEVRAVRGRAVFESAQAGCAGCHAGDQLTDNRNHDVGLGRATQTPALRGLAHRTRFMHDGCAESLEDRFEASCGGTAHGGIDHLGPEELGDLVEFLRTL